MFGSRRFRLIGLTAVLSVVAVSCSSGDEAAAPTATSSDPDLPTSPTATAIVARTTPTPDASGSPTPVAHRPPVRVEIPPTGPTTTADGLTVQEVLRRSKEHALAATSFRSRSVPPESHGAEARERSRASFIEYVAPDMQRRIGSDGEVDMIVVGDALYRPSSNDDGKWWISEGFQGFVAAALPTRMIPFDLAGASFIDLGDPEYFVIQGYANSLYRVGASPLPGTDTPKLHELRIRKDTFEFFSSRSWAIPLVVEHDETLDETTLLVRQAEILARPEDVGLEIFHYNVDIDIQPPDSWFAGAFPREPMEDDTGVHRNTKITYLLTQPVEIADLSISPEIELTFLGEEPAQGSAVRRRYDLVTPLELATEYTLTLTWGNSESDMQTMSWSFTTGPSAASAIRH